MGDTGILEGRLSVLVEPVLKGLSDKTAEKNERVEDVEDGVGSAKKRREPDALMDHMIEVIRMIWTVFMEACLPGGQKDPGEAGR